jgi:hypothetical protein
MGYVPTLTDCQEATMPTSRVTVQGFARRRSPIALSLLLPVTFLMASCGGDDAGPASGSPAETTVAADPNGTVDPAAETTEPTADADLGTNGSGDSSDAGTAEIGEIDGIEDLAGAIGGEELTNAIDALGIDTRMKIVADQLGGTYEVTGDSTAFLYLDGDADTDGIMVCFVVGAISSPGDVVVVAYPNGDVVCD